MDTGQIGPPGARAARHAVTARGLKPGLVLTRLRLRVANLVREVVREPEFAIYANALVLLKYLSFIHVNVNNMHQ